MLGLQGLSVGRTGAVENLPPSPSQLFYLAFHFSKDKSIHRKKIQQVARPTTANSLRVSLPITCAGYLSMALPTRGRVIINTTVGELDIELWSRVRNKLCRHEHILRSESRPRSVQRHAETSSRSLWRVSFRPPPPSIPVVHSSSLRQGYYDGVVFHR